MAPKAHVFCVPFPGAGHAVNMFNAAVTMATPEIIVHVLVMSEKKGKQWSKATGQAPNPNVHVEVLANGAWEEWKEVEPRDLVMKIQSPDFNQAVSDRVNQVKESNPRDKCTAIVINGLMNGLANVAAEQKLKMYLLAPTAQYMNLIGFSQKEGDDAKTPITFRGIGGSSEDFEGELGDVIEFLGPMYRHMFRPTIEKADGQIYTNTNSGLDGNEDFSKLSPLLSKDRSFMIGPILPPWFERALDDPQILKDHLATNPNEDDESIHFMNSHASKSVVYVALGSHVELTIPQAEAIIKNLRNHKVPWVLLYRENTEAMKKALAIDGKISDGIVTPWAPQLSILQHPALKCVVSHGGFGTMVEGVYAGQPFITSPVASDQFIDTRVMRHLGICLGTLAVNKYLSVMERNGELTPIWPDDNGKNLEELFDRVFGTPQGDKELEKAREASKKLRRRMLDAKEGEAKGELEKLRKALMTPKQ